MAIAFFKFLRFSDKPVDSLSLFDTVRITKNTAGQNAYLERISALAQLSVRLLILCLIFEF
jgi:hypothetical protein